MVVPVLMMSCQVFENWKIGPVVPQTRMTTHASAKAGALPAQCVVAVENRSSAALSPLFLFRVIRALYIHRRTSRQGCAGYV